MTETYIPSCCLQLLAEVKIKYTASLFIESIIIKDVMCHRRWTYIRTGKGGIDYWQLLPPGERSYDPLIPKEKKS